ncbi:glycosyltransferase family 4 protein [Gelidibacter mesophilus]|uniref:glycosyltransferase family 4 protein n=1 Tax=Gelidibacter mesophilus TaxID=169050 RepID=UPI00047FB129|nr:glycosyltransferase family 4 protein [Gelidibacter mesophilus]
MKIIFLARYLPAEGSTTHMYSVAKNLIERGEEVYILSRGHADDPSAINLFEKARLDGIRFVELPFPLYTKVNFISKIKQLCSYIYATPFALYQFYKLKPDVIHSHYAVTTYLAAIHRFFTGKKFIITHHIMGIPKHFLNRKADYAIAISRELKTFLISSYNYEESQVELIFNGVEKRENEINQTKIISLKKEFSIPSDKIIFGFVGSLSYRKGVDVLLKAFSTCTQFNVHLIILGDGEIDWVKEMINEYQLNDIVSLIPFRDPKDIYRMIDTLILPSRREGFPLVPLEAMMMKKPVIRSNTEGAHDQIIDGNNGYVFESENHLELAKIIEKISNTPQSLERLGENAYQHAMHNFTEDAMIDKMMALYQKTQ